jgi:hypothetical protein
MMSFITMVIVGIIFYLVGLLTNYDVEVPEYMRVINKYKEYKTLLGNDDVKCKYEVYKSSFKIMDGEHHLNVYNRFPIEDVNKIIKYGIPVDIVK